MSPRFAALLVLAATFILGCQKDFAAVPESDCPKVIEHSKALLGEGAKGKSQEEMMAVCKASSPKQRGCALAATEAADIMKCSLVKE